MAKQKSEFVSSLGTAFEIVKALAEDVYAEGGSDDDIRRILKERPLRKEMAKLLVINREDTYSVTIDRDKRLQAMIEAGRYDWKNSDINEKNFQVNGSGTETIDIVLHPITKIMSTDAVLADLDKNGLRPATLEELLALGAQHPDFQRKFPIVALGSVWRDGDGDCRVAVLCGIAGGRGLGLDWIGNDLDADYRFAAVRK